MHSASRFRLILRSAFRLYRIAWSLLFGYPPQQGVSQYGNPLPACPPFPLCSIVENILKALDKDAVFANSYVGKAVRVTVNSGWQQYQPQGSSASNGAHVCLAGSKMDPRSPENKPEKVHTAFLRRISGMGKAVHQASLDKEYGRYPLMLQWLILAARFWNKMADRSESALIHMAYKDSVELMLRGKKCWT